MMTSKELIPKDRWLKLAKEYRYWANKNTWCPFYKDLTKYSLHEKLIAKIRVGKHQYLISRLRFNSLNMKYPRQYSNEYTKTDMKVM